MAAIKRALISVSDKTDIIPFASGLTRLGIRIISTGGTARILQDAGVSVDEVSSITGFSELLDGRVKTLHPGVHAGVLAVRNNQDHMAQLKHHAIEPIDMVVVNLYPFVKVVAREGVTLNEAIENIDIGGVALLRSAAKNFKDVAVVGAPERYEVILAELKENSNELTDTTRWHLAEEAFAMTAHYDSHIYAYLRMMKPERDPLQKDFPETFTVIGERAKALRYGENPHQGGCLYTTPPGGKGVASWQQHQGKEISFNNIYDMDAAIQIACSFTEPACAVIKHATPCGIAVGAHGAEAFIAAMDSDRLSAFGGIVAFNQEVDEKGADEIINAGFLECIIAPSFSTAALSVLAAKKNLRAVSAPLYETPVYTMKMVEGGFLLQHADTMPKEIAYKVVTEKQPTDEEVRSLIFAWKSIRCARSNAIVVACGTQSIGIGAGLVSRIDAMYMALHKAGDKAQGSVLASDGFFPMRDTIDAAAAQGISAIIQPGGSIKDAEVIAAANEAGLAMLFTSRRCFKH